ncbi:MAG: carbohydrate ABC transporter permease [Janthinobacterium lividum]
MAFPKKLCLTGLAWSVALLMSSPIVLMIVTAFKPDAVVDLGPFASFTPTLATFASQNANVGMLRPVLNSVVEAGDGTLLCLLFAIPAAYGLAFHAGRTRNAVLLGLLMTRFMPGVGIMIPMYLIFKATGLIDTQIGLMLIYAMINMPIVIWMLYSYMRDVPREILDSARVDGASVPQQIVFLLLPLCAPGLASTALLSIVLCWNEAFWSIQMTSAEGAPLSAYIASLSGGPLPAEISAASLIAIAPILVVGWLTQRQFARGLTFGAVR